MENVKIVDNNEKLLSIEFAPCKKCKEEKARIVGGLYPNGKDTKYVDQNDRQWNGRLCPDCHNDGRKDHQKLRRVKNRYNADKRKQKYLKVKARRKAKLHEIKINR